MFSWILYSLFRVLAQVYLYFANTAGHWKVIQNSWEKNNVKFNRFRIQNEGHERYFVFVDAFDIEDNLDWHEIIKFSDSILACIITSARGNEESQNDITDMIKEFSHYIYSNPFLTFKDFVTLFDIGTNGPYYNLTIIFDDLSEKECFVKDEDSLKMTFTLNPRNSDNSEMSKMDNLNDVPYM